MCNEWQKGTTEHIEGSWHANVSRKNIPKTDKTFVFNFYLNGNRLF